MGFIIYNMLLRILTLKLIWLSIIDVVSTYSYTYSVALSDGIEWISISSSDSGQYLNAAVDGGAIYSSADYGASWDSNADTLDWTAVSTSGSGEIVYATVSVGSVYLSTDYGVSFTAFSFLSGTGAWVDVASSSDGETMLTCDSNGYCYFTNDMGEGFFTITTLGSDENWACVEVSGNGEVMAIGSEQGTIYLSVDAGVAWTTYQVNSKSEVRGVGMSYTGLYIVFTLYSKNIYYSSDYGTSFAVASSVSNLNFLSVASSGSGQYVSVSVYGGEIYLSDNYGATFISSASDELWTGIASNYSGNQLVGCVYDQGIIIGTQTGIPTPSPISSPSLVPSNSPSYLPSQKPTFKRTNHPSFLPSLSPIAPTNGPSLKPTSVPTDHPTYSPSTSPIAPTERPSFKLSCVPTDHPTYSPSTSSIAPTIRPSLKPTSGPIEHPTYSPSISPIAPTERPSFKPSCVPTEQSTIIPSLIQLAPTIRSSLIPTSGPTSIEPTNIPTQSLATPTLRPSIKPSSHPTEQLTRLPSLSPVAPTINPSTQDSSSMKPSVVPTDYQSYAPTFVSSTKPSYNPVFESTKSPTKRPSPIISYLPTGPPTYKSSSFPSSVPTRQEIPSSTPTTTFSSYPSALSVPTISPTAFPSFSNFELSEQPTVLTLSLVPSTAPSFNPTSRSSAPTAFPFFQLSESPSYSPVTVSVQPSLKPVISGSPTIGPSPAPAMVPSIVSKFPFSKPSFAPFQVPTAPPTTFANSYFVFTSNITLGNVTTSTFDADAQSAIVVSTAQCMDLSSSDVSYISSHLVPVDSTNTSDRRFLRSYSEPDKEMVGTRKLQEEAPATVAVLETTVFLTSGESYEAVYNSIAVMLETAVTNKNFTLVLRNESRHYAADETLYAVGLAVFSSEPVLFAAPSPAPTSSSSVDLISTVGTIIPGIFCWFLIAVILYVRFPKRLELNELNTVFSELVDAAMKCVIIFLSINLLVEVIGKKYLISLIILIVSRIVMLIFWVSFLVSYFSPLQQHYQVFGRVHMALLLRKESLQSKFKLSIYGLLISLSLLDLTFLRLLPWARTSRTKNTLGYPSMFVMRCCLYGSFLSHCVQSVAVIIKLFVEGGGEGSQELNYVLLVFTVFNACRTFVTIVLIIQKVKTEQLRLALVNEGDLSAIATLTNSTRDSTSAGVKGQQQSAMTPDLITEYLSNWRSSRQNSEAVENPILTQLATPPSLEEEVEPTHRVEKVKENDFITEEEIEKEKENNTKEKEEKKKEVVVDEENSTQNLFLTTAKHADKTLQILRTQLQIEGKIPVEFIPLVELREEIGNLIVLANQAMPYDEQRLDYLLKCLEMNPEFQEEERLEKARWREEIGEFARDCVMVMRGFVPPDVFRQTSESLMNEHEFSRALAMRVMQKKCLWLVRMTVTDIQRIHFAELSGKYNYEGQNLDIVETAAIYAILPEIFNNDSYLKKRSWREGLESSLKSLLKQKELGSIAANRLRNPVYKGQESRFSDLDQLHAMEVIEYEDVFKPRTSFLNLNPNAQQTTDTETRTSEVENGARPSRFEIEGEEGRVASKDLSMIGRLSSWIISDRSALLSTDQRRASRVSSIGTGSGGRGVVGGQGDSGGSALSKQLKSFFKK